MSDAGTITVNCGDTLDISRVGELYTELEMIINEKKAIEFDASEIERIDTSGLQLLLSFYQKIKSSGFDFHWISPSEHLLRSASLVGLDKLLGLSE
ncbi:hypothetical protein MNBD_GAMMA18-2261 [hydrothermal vent metagenome]|uniref:STAS domain-containing protein n=1 Tax=hydrothermal vent metagenome TaxID=652676 RepID=A0A3B0ZJZ9_9ZZZZ